MSSTVYFAEILPDPVLRRIVLASGVVLALAGVPLIQVLPVAAEVRATATLLWLAFVASELTRARLAWVSCHAVRFFTDGSVAVLIPDQNWRPATLLAGGVLLQRLGWIRLSVVLPNGRNLVLGEFVCGDSRKSADWRRLQVIWRHIGAQVRSC